MMTRSKTRKKVKTAKSRYTFVGNRPLELPTTQEIKLALFAITLAAIVAVGLYFTLTRGMV